jgi:hypothetical protein
MDIVYIDTYSKVSLNGITLKAGEIGPPSPYATLAQSRKHLEQGSLSSTQRLISDWPALQYEQRWGLGQTRGVFRFCRPEKPTSAA